MENICIPLKNGRFNYRVGAIIIHQNKLLMVSNDTCSHYYSVGGRVQFGETSKEALQREMKEEIGHGFTIGDLAIVQESFYPLGEAQEKIHEISLYYHVEYDENRPIKKDYFFEGDDKEYFTWLALDQLDQYEIYPSFFKDELLEKYQNKHFIDNYFD